jgi:hypothetical protein
MMSKNPRKSGIAAIRHVLNQLISEGSVQKTRVQKSDAYRLK